MKPVAILQTQTSDIDTIILWDDSNRIIAVAYHDGRVRLTRPLEASTITTAVTETLDALSIGTAQLTTIADLAPRPVAQLADRWH